MWSDELLEKLRRARQTPQTKAQKQAEVQIASALNKLITSLETFASLQPDTIPAQQCRKRADYIKSII